jgi:hypothetical protein
MPQHPAFRVSARVLRGLFEDGCVSPQFSTEAMRREVRQDPDDRGQVIMDREMKWDCPEVARLFKIINVPTVTVLVKNGMVRRLEEGTRISQRGFQEWSVQVWTNKLSVWPIRPIKGHEELYAWTGKYDGFLGYMAGVLPLLDGDSFII